MTLPDPFPAPVPDHDLTRRRSLPPGAVLEDWRAGDGWRVRMVHWLPDTRRPSILFLNGRADFIEKYAESYWHWRDRGYGVMTFDWRGQGASGRFPPGSGGYFETWLDDLAGIAAHAETVLGGPLVIAGHSMGGHLALRHLAAGGAPRFRRALLFAPMAGIAAHGIPGGALYWLARARVKAGVGDAYPPMQGPYGERTRGVRRQRLLTGDADRFADEDWWIQARPELALGGASWRWIVEATASCRALAAPGLPESIRLPVDVFMGDGERLVDAAAARRLVNRLPGGRWHDVPGAAHELLREGEAVQAAVHAVIDGLLQGAS